MRLPLLVSLLAVLAACDSGSDSARGQFDVTISGAVDVSLSGPAAIDRDERPGEEAHVTITMVPGGFADVGFTIVGSEAVLSRTGTIDLSDIGSPTLIYSDSRTSSGPYGATGGSLTLTRSTDDRITGAFTATMERPNNLDEGIEAIGSFDAVPRDGSVHY